MGNSELEFIDLDYRFRKASSGDVAAVNGEDAINQALLALFSTRRGERFFNPRFGTAIQEMLFEPFDEETANLILDEIKQGILTFEPRAEIVTLTISMDYEQLLYEVSLVYNIVSTTETGSFDIKLRKR